MSHRVVSVQLTLLVDDQKKAEEFYCRCLGLFEKGRAGTLVLSSNPRFSIQPTIIARDSPTKLLVGQQAGDQDVLMVLVLDDCGPMYDQLLAAGVKFKEPLHGLPYGRQMILFDPFGNLICLMDVAGESAIYKDS